MGYRKVTVTLLLVMSFVFVGCFDEIGVGEHGCANCPSCEVCVEDPAGAYCAPISRHYVQCGADAQPHWFDSCDAMEGIVSDCVNGDCIDVSDVEALCECHTNWEGNSCDVCPGNWDEDKNCAQCESPWIDNDDDCGSCLDNWDPVDFCLDCVGNWDVEEECFVCENNWIDEDNDCGTCPGNWDPGQDCADCVGNWDVASGCTECSNSWTDENNDCGTCPGNWDGDQDCADCVGNWDVASGCTECSNSWTDENNDCGTCPGNWDPGQDCADCVGNWDAASGCTECSNSWTDENNDCGTCPGNWDPGQDCADCFDNWDPSQDCAFCDGYTIEDTNVCGNGIVESGEECDDCKEQDWDGCHECRVVEIQIQHLDDVNDNYDRTDIALGPEESFAVAYFLGSAPGAFGVLYDGSVRPAVTPPPQWGSPYIGVWPEGNMSLFFQHNGEFAIAQAFIPAHYGERQFIRVQWYDDSGLMTGVPVDVDPASDLNQYSPQAATGGNGESVVVWGTFTNGYEVMGLRGQKIYEDGAFYPESFVVVDQGAFADVWDVAMDGSGNMVVVWDRAPYIYARLFDANSDPITSAFTIDDYDIAPSGIRGEPTVAMAADGRFVVAWNHFHDDPIDWQFDRQTFMVRLYDADGTPATDPFEVEEDTTWERRNPAVAMGANGEFVVVWQSIDPDGVYSDIYGGLYTADGVPKGERFQVNSHTYFRQHYPAVSMAADGRFAVTWNSDWESSVIVESIGSFQRFDADGTPLGTLPWDHYQ